MAGAIDCNVWLEHVASGANIADLPSRGEFALLRRLGSVRFETTLPPIGGDWSSVYRDTYFATTRRAPRMGSTPFPPRGHGGREAPRDGEPPGGRMSVEVIVT